MKFMKFAFPKKYLFFIGFASMLVFSRCVEKDPITRISQVLLVPLSPNAPSIDFEINGTRFATTVGYSSTVGTVRYTLPYYTVDPKQGSKIAYKFNGSNADVAFVTTDLSDEKAYSTFLIDSFAKVKAVMVNDNLTPPSAGMVKLRFFNFSPNVTAIDVENVLTSGNTKLFSNRSFNDQSTNSAFENFIEIPAGNYTFAFRVISSGLIGYTTTTQTFLPDRIYTLAARGFAGGAGAQALGAWVYPNLP
jgi:hypothetical protein